jgi:hypothetical protein
MPNGSGGGKIREVWEKPLIWFRKIVLFAFLGDGLIHHLGNENT